MRELGILLLFFICFNSYAQKVDVSLFMKKDKDVYLDKVESTSGNLFTKLGHHGPAIENEWFGLRIYFNKKMAIDVYSKSKPGLELKETRWYPSKEQQKEGWGSDYYKVGNTVGLGGIRLWDGEKIIPLNPVSNRSAVVKKTEEMAYMEVLSEGISYKGNKIDILLKVAVYAEDRMAQVEASVPSGEQVYFVTGINYHKGLIIEKGENYISTWGIHPEDVAIEKVEVGAAIIYEGEDVLKSMDDGKQYLLISKPTDQLIFAVTTCNAKEPDLNSPSKFVEFLNQEN